MKLIVSILFLLSSTIKVFAQDPIFSLYFNNLISLNPALTGVSGTFNISSQFRYQWVPIINNNYTTSKVNFDFGICSGNVNRMGVGLALYSNKGGDGFLYNNFVGFDYSYMAINHTKYHKSHLLSFGLEGGWGITYVDWNKLVFSNQLDPRDGFIYGSTNSLALKVANNKNFQQRSFADFASGIFYRYKNTRTKKTRLSGGNIGLAIHHITQPNNGLAYGNTYGLPIKITMHGGVEFPFYSKLKRNTEFLRLQVRARLTSQRFDNKTFTLFDIGNTFIISERRLYFGFLLRFPPSGTAFKNTYGTSFFAGYLLSHKTPQINLAYAYENSFEGISKDIIASNTNSHELSLTFLINNRRNCSPKSKKDFPCADF